MFGFHAALRWYDGRLVCRDDVSSINKSEWRPAKAGEGSGSSGDLNAILANAIPQPVTGPCSS